MRRSLLTPNVSAATSCFATRLTVFFHFLVGNSYRWDTPTLMDAILLFFGGLVGGFAGCLVPVWAHAVALGGILTILAFMVGS
jgi:hypothetical protein